MRYPYFVFRYIRSFPFVRYFVRTMILLVFALIYLAVVMYTSIFFIYNSDVLSFVEGNNLRSLYASTNVYLDPFYY